ncbi:MAG: hypothetical protein ACRDJX_11805 [Solirubrobacteraceae bacterium]
MSAASPEEAAAIVSAIERFMRATAAPPSTASAPPADGWRAAALLDGVSGDPWATTAAGEGWLGATPG